MGLKNLPTEKARSLEELIDYRKRQVSSLALADFSAPIDLTLLAFEAGESVSEEEYFGDTLYYILEGSASIKLPEESIEVKAGEVLMVPAHVLHAVEGNEAFKLLQLSL